MAQRGAELDRETVSCPICLDLLKDPVTTPCGHSYCMSCIQSYWDEEDEEKIYSCPQCSHVFTPRPVLLKNTVSGAVVEEQKKTGLHAAPAEPEEVACDVCNGRKLKAVKSCLVCLVSCCENHLQPHFDVPPFKKHKLVEPSKKLQENICSRHDEVMNMFCRTDQQCICYLCPLDEHQGHDTVSAAVERTERQIELEANILQRIQDREKDVEVLQQEVEAINVSADETVKHSEQMFTRLIRLLEERRSDVTQQVRSQQQTEVSRVEELQEKLQQEITDLKRRDAELKELSNALDHNQFLLSWPSLSDLSEYTHSSSINVRPRRHFEDVTAALTELQEHLEEALRDSNVSWTVSQVDVLLTEPHPKTRQDFFKYSCEITLDPNTAYRHLLLSDGNRKAERLMHQLYYSVHPDRFTENNQVLSVESLTGRCYWEVERSEGIQVAVSYKNISRAGYSDECVFGRNENSWSLICSSGSYEFCHNNIRTSVSGPLSSKVGVYLDHSAGVLSFYSISDTMTLLHRVQTTFTQPLHAGLTVYYKSKAKICKLK